MEKGNRPESGEGCRVDGTESPMGVEGKREGVICSDSQVTGGRVNVNSV